MKKFLVAIGLLLLAPAVAHAYGPINHGYIVMKTGLPGLLVETQTADGWSTFFISIKGEDLNLLETENADIVAWGKGEIRLAPRVDTLPDENDYRLWKIHGTYKDQFFLIGGFTLEGEVLRNKIVPHTFGLFVMFLVFSFSTMVWQGNKGELDG